MIFTRYYKKKNKEKLKKILVKGIKIFLKNKTTKNATMVVKDIKTFQKIKNKD